jgi:hypothetical protein
MLDTRAFLDALAAHPEADLAFSHADFGVPGGFHLTEVRALAVEGMDCGGRADRWFETHFQLWHPRHEHPGGRDGPRLTAGKFLGIVGRVRSAVPLRDAAAARIEWGDAARPAVLYPVSGVREAGGVLTVSLSDPRVTCKAGDRRAEEAGQPPRPVLGSACC